LEYLKKSTIPQGTSDEKLVNMAMSGNTLAFTSLVERHTRYVSGIASRFLMREEETRDVVQDTFIRVWKHLANYNGHTLFTTWLYAIAFNLCLDRIRVKKRKAEFRFTEENMGRIYEQADSTDPVNDIDSGSITRAIRNYSEELSMVQRHVFVLRDLHDLPVSEVCRLTGYDTDKVKANLYHARKFMREKLTKGGYL
jgi:RNA polymerase sigma-70 factor (ECF subfamily)